MQIVINFTVSVLKTTEKIDFKMLNKESCSWGTEAKIIIIFKKKKIVAHKLLNRKHNGTKKSDKNPVFKY